MKLKLTLAAGLFSVLALGSIPQITSAATIGPHTPIPGASAGGLSVETVQYGGYCRAVRRECADRWGWGGWRFRRCLERRGC